jgi:hypothetical protein
MMKQLPHALVVGTIAAFAIFISSQLAIPAWAIFIGWVSYFLFSTNIKEGLLCFFHLVSGLLLAALVIILTTHLNVILQNIALIIVVFVLAASLTFIEPVKLFNNIPAYYIGMIVLFASAQPPKLFLLMELSGSLAIGLFLGFFTVSIRSKLLKISSH